MRAVFEQRTTMASGDNLVLNVLVPNTTPTEWCPTCPFIVVGLSFDPAAFTPVVEEADLGVTPDPQCEQGLRVMWSVDHHSLLRPFVAILPRHYTEMKLVNDMEDATTDKKFFKSQMERRRRERMNRSLERLRSLLLQGPQQQCGDQRRPEKAEVLEHTVLFLHSKSSSSSSSSSSSEEHGAAACHSFQDGFSACLERAAHFLGPRGEGLRTAVTLDTTLAVRLVTHAGLKAVSSVAKQPKVGSPSVRRLKHARTASSALSVRGFTHLSKPCPARRQSSTHGAGPTEARAHRGPATTVSPPLSLSPFQSLWRPWP
ncbi:unnamed protein product [Merluccius merluccius]